MRALLGVYLNHKPNQAVLITTSSFSDEAKEFASDIAHWLTLIDRAGVMELMGKYVDYKAVSTLVSSNVTSQVKRVPFD